MNFKLRIFSLAFASLISVTNCLAETLEPIKFGNFDSWITRYVKESGIIGGKTKTLYEIGPTQNIEKPNTAYSNLGGSPWATSNAYAKVAGVSKGSVSVVPEDRNGGKCAKMSTLFEHVKALGIINLDVLVSGSIYLGRCKEPITSSNNPYGKMEMGIPYTKRPKALVFDYKVFVPTDGKLIYSSGFSKQKILAGQDHAEVYVILQRRWEDPDGSLHAARVGTGRQRFSASTNNWVNGYHLPIYYGNITSKPFYKPWMGLINGDKAYYAYNSKGKLVPVQEEIWDDENATPTHVLVMASAGCGTAYTGTVGMTLWFDNAAFAF